MKILWRVLRRPDVLAGWAIVIGMCILAVVRGGAELLLLIIPAAAIGTGVRALQDARRPASLAWPEVLAHADRDRPRRSNVVTGVPLVAVRVGDGPRVVAWVAPMDDGKWVVHTSLGTNLEPEVEAFTADELDRRERDWNLRYLPQAELSDQVWRQYFGDGA